MKKRKLIVNSLSLIIIFSITVYFIFRGQDISGLLQNIKSTDSKFWLLAALCVLFFIGCESIIIFYMMITIRQKVNLLHCLLYSFVGFFFSCITPSATGGQPAQIYFMKKDKIPIPVATLVLMIVTVTYKMVLVILGAAVFMIRPVKIMSLLHPVLGICYLGFVLNVICVGFMLLIIFHPTMAQNQLTAIVKLFGKIRIIKRTDYYLHKVEGSMMQYKNVALYFRTHEIVISNVLIITLFQRLLLFYVTYLTYRSFGLNSIDFITIVVLQGMISVAVDMLPLPGGMGISEKMFLMIFTPVFGSMALPAMVISRGLSYYTELIISALFTLVSFFTIGRKMERKNEE
jgi:conserved hypothetical protein